MSCQKSFRVGLAVKLPFSNVLSLLDACIQHKPVQIEQPHAFHLRDFLSPELRDGVEGRHARRCLTHIQHTEARHGRIGRRRYDERALERFAQMGHRIGQTFHLSQQLAHGSGICETVGQHVGKQILHAPEQSDGVEIAAAQH